MNIGLIAMSGLRVCDQELLELGLSFPMVSARAKQIEALPSLGLLTIAALIPEGHACEYLEVRDIHDDIPIHFDAVFISCLTATSKEAYKIAKLFKQIGTHVVMGGLHVTLNPHEAMQHVDTVVIGEGEPVMKEIFRDIEIGKPKEIYDAKKGLPFNFEDAPLPRFDLIRPERYTRFSLQTQRGCPLSCSFCASSIRLHPKFRVKPVNKVVEEIRFLKSLNERPFIEFADDNTFSNRKHSKRLMRALEKESVRWFTETDISIADDKDLLKQIRDAGCQQVLIGLESPDALSLEGIETKANWKAKRAAKYHQAIETIQSHGIAVNGCFVLGLDGQTTSAFDHVANFVESSGLFDVQITYLTPFPGTPMYQNLSEEGRILVPDAHERCTLFDINFKPNAMSVSELKEGFHRLMARLYTPDNTLLRKKKFFSHRRSGRKKVNE